MGEQSVKNTGLYRYYDIFGATHVAWVDDFGKVVIAPVKAMVFEASPLVQQFLGAWDHHPSERELEIASASSPESIEQTYGITIDEIQRRWVTGDDDQN